MSRSFKNASLVVREIKEERLFEVLFGFFQGLSLVTQVEISE
jgi:hypothetical protein